MSSVLPSSQVNDPPSVRPAAAVALLGFDLPSHLSPPGLKHMCQERAGQLGFPFSLAFLLVRGGAVPHLQFLLPAVVRLDMPVCAGMACIAVCFACSGYSLDMSDVILLF
mgnify:CR=1 FL=1